MQEGELLLKILLETLLKESHVLPQPNSFRVNAARLEMCLVARGIVLEFLVLLVDFLELLDLDRVGGAIDFYNVFVRIANRSSCKLPMLLVVAHAEPAELVLAVGAGHVHASLIFLNIAFALWALLRVNYLPCLVVCV